MHPVLRSPDGRHDLAQQLRGWHDERSPNGRAGVTFDVARVRGLYPTLGARVAYLDGNFSALQPETVIRAIITTLRSAPAQPGSQSARSQRAAGSVHNARRAIGDLVGAGPDCVVLGGNVTVLVEQFAMLIGQEWRLGDEIVLSRLDQDGSVRPWLGAAKTSGAVVHWAEVDVETGELPEWQYDRLITRRTRLVTVPVANLATGAVPNVRPIADLAHTAGALVVVDVGAALPHMPLDIAALGADLITVAVEGFGGPTLGAIVAREGLLYELDEHAAEPVPQRYEVGALPVELLDGAVAAVDHLAGLDDWATGSRRQRLVASLRAAGEYEHQLFAVLERRLRATRGVTVLGSPAQRVPLVSFGVEGRKAAEVGDYLKSRGVSVWTGATGMSRFMSTLGADELGGTVHAGLMPHTTWAETDQLLAALDDLV